MFNDKYFLEHSSTRPVCRLFSLPLPGKSYFFYFLQITDIRYKVISDLHYFHRLIFQVLCSSCAYFSVHNYLFLWSVIVKVLLHLKIYKNCCGGNSLCYWTLMLLSTLNIYKYKQFISSKLSGWKYNSKNWTSRNACTQMFSSK